MALDRAQAKVDGAQADMIAAQNAKDSAIKGVVSGAFDAVGPISSALKPKDAVKQAGGLFKKEEEKMKQAGAFDKFKF